MCSLMIHLFHKCNYITTLISDGHRPMPRDALFPDFAEKKDHTPWSRRVIKMNDHQVQYFLKLQRRLANILENQVWPLQRATSLCLLDLVMGGIYTLGHIFALSKHLVGSRASAPSPLPLWEVTQWSSTTRPQKDGHRMPLIIPRTPQWGEPRER